MKRSGITTSSRLVMLLLLAVLVPSVCLLWFMNQAVKSERSAARQKLFEAYRGHLALAQERLEKRLEEVSADLERSLQARGPISTFAFAVRSNLADAVICFDEFGFPTYPGMTQSPKGQAVTPEWEHAQSLELTDPASAAKSFATLAEQTTNSNVAGMALQAQIRSLVAAGQKNEAAQILSRSLSDKRLERARDSQNRLIVADLELMALELRESSNPKEQREVFESLRKRLENYDGEYMPASQRRFLMRELAARSGQPASSLFPTLAAEEIAARVFESRPPRIGEPGVMRTGPVPGVWQISSAHRRVLMLERTENLEGRLSSWVPNQTLPADVKLVVLPPRDGSQESQVQSPTSNSDKSRAGVQSPKSAEDSAVPVNADSRELVPPKGTMADADSRGLVPPKGRMGNGDSQELVLPRELVPPRELVLPKGEGLISMPAGAALPGWRLALSLKDERFFKTAADQRIASYLWIGILVLATVFILAALVLGLVRRQVALTQLRNDLVANVTHELKTPLSSMRLLVDTLLGSPRLEEKTTREYLQLIAGENLRLSRLIDNFLTFSRIERNKYTFKFEALPASRIVEAAVASVRDRFNAPGCELKIEASPDLPSVVVDSDAMVTALINLLDNAFKYTGDEKRITLNAAAENGCVRFCVKDNGIGLSERDTKRIFKRFYQVDQRLSRTGGGCGLGLSIVKFIVTAHHGDIEVQSEPGKGSAFTMTIPVSPESRNRPRSIV